MSSAAVAASLAAAGQVASSAIDYYSARSANKANKRLMQKKMNWEERMSNTAYQRQVKDMMAAGINPLYGLGSGASTPGGEGAQMRPELQSKLDLATVANVYNNAKLVGERAEGQALENEGKVAENVVKELKAEIARSAVGRYSKYAMEVLPWLLPVGFGAKAIAKGLGWTSKAVKGYKAAKGAKSAWVAKKMLSRS